MEETNFLVEPQVVAKAEPQSLFSPKNPSPAEKLFLSNIDQAVTFPVEIVFFFEVEPEMSASTVGIAERVKRAVAEVLLVPYYFMAGRLNFNSETGRLELLCNNAGVDFVSAASGLRLKDLGKLFLPNPSFSHFVHRPGLFKSPADTPLLTIQVTRFKCGGFSLGFVTNHSILDGRSASEMFKDLASICRDIEGGTHESIKAKIIHNDRTCITARNPPHINFPHKEYVKQTDLISSLPSSFTPPNQSSPSPLIFSKQYTHRLFPFSPQMVTTLKALSLTKNCSSFEAIVAHLWRARTKAVLQNPDEVSTVLFAVDVRSKISPPLPSEFAGNAVITAFATARVAELVARPLSFAVEKVKGGRERVTDEYVRSVIDWLEVYRGIPATGHGSFYVSAWWKLPFAELDFGFGKPVHGGPVVSGNDEFVLLLADGVGNNGGGINVWMALEEEQMKRFMVHVFEI
ncbi:acyltransferase GLAUCE-like [Malania oleifera]|uniref:acyltransferase GLAUCE-like n=1 Tax=Malania oleifera TaxID=397392 RepID=UPI0025AE1EF5|nr:acyltransferase GLAUCE-like [Malania oleifera]